MAAEILAQNKSTYQDLFLLIKRINELTLTAWSWDPVIVCSVALYSRGTSVFFLKIYFYIYIYLYHPGRQFL